MEIPRCRSRPHPILKGGTVDCAAYGVAWDLEAISYTPPRCVQHDEKHVFAEGLEEYVAHALHEGLHFAATARKLWLDVPRESVVEATVDERATVAALADPVEEIFRHRGVVILATLAPIGGRTQCYYLQTASGRTVHFPSGSQNVDVLPVRPGASSEHGDGISIAPRSRCE